MKINETVYWHAKEGYQTIGYDGEEKDVLDIELSNSDLPVKRCILTIAADYF